MLGILEEDVMDGDVVWGMRKTLCKAEDEISFWRVLRGKRGVRREKHFHGDQSRSETTLRWNVLSIWCITLMEKPVARKDCLDTGLAPPPKKRCTLVASRRSGLKFTAGCHGYLRFATPAQWLSSHVWSFFVCLSTLKKPHFILLYIVTAFRKTTVQAVLI